MNSTPSYDAYLKAGVAFNYHSGSRLKHMQGVDASAITSLSVFLCPMSSLKYLLSSKRQTAHEFDLRELFPLG